MHTNILVYENCNFIDLPTTIMTEEMVLRLGMSKFEPQLPKTLKSFCVLLRIYTSVFNSDLATAWLKLNT